MRNIEHDKESSTHKITAIIKDFFTCNFNQGFYPDLLSVEKFK